MSEQTLGEIRSCPRPAESVLLLRGAYRTRCVMHAVELRRQGATLTELEPGFDHPPGQTPEPLPNLPEVPVCKVPDCTNEAKTRGLCALHYGRALRTLQREGAIQESKAGHLLEAEILAAVLRWTPAPNGPTPKTPEVTNADTPAPAMPAPSSEPSGGIFDTIQANNAVATAGARLRDVLRKIAGFSDDEITTPSDEVIIERALAEHRRRNQVDANHLDVLATLQRPRLLTEDELERRWAALGESRKLRAIALGEVSDVS